MSSYLGIAFLTGIWISLIDCKPPVLRGPMSCHQNKSCGRFKNSAFYFRCVEVGDDDDDGDTVKLEKVLSRSKFVKTFYNFVLLKKALPIFARVGFFKGLNNSSGSCLLKGSYIFQIYYRWLNKYCTSLMQYNVQLWHDSLQQVHLKRYFKRKTFASCRDLIPWSSDSCHQVTVFVMSAIFLLALFGSEGP